MNVKFLWADGELEIAPGFSKIHHFNLIQRMIQNGKLPAGQMPENYVGGDYSSDPFHGSEFDVVRILWQGGVHPTSEELKYIVGRELDRFGDRESEYQRKSALPKIVWVEHEVTGDWGYGGQSRRPVIWMPKENTLLVGERDSSHYETLANHFGEIRDEETWGYHGIFFPEHGPAFLQDYRGPIPPQSLVELVRRGDARRTSATSEDTEPVGDQVGFLRDPHDKLYPPAFGESETMDESIIAKLKAYVLNEIEKEYKDPDQFIYFTVFGSGASYNWDELGDFDIQMWVDHTKFLAQNEGVAIDQDDLIADIRRMMQPINFPSFADLGLTTKDEDGGEGKMLIQYYAKPGTGSPEENLASKPYACYDMETGEWLVKPDPIRPTFYGEAFGLVKAKAEEVATQAEGLIGELQRHVLNWQFWYGMYRRYRNPKYRAEFEDSQAKADQLKEGVISLFNGVFEGRKGAYSEEGKGYQDERDFLQKLLEVWGTFQKLKHYAREPLPWEAQELPGNDVSDDVEDGEQEKDDDSNTEDKIKSSHTWIISEPGWSVKIHKIAEWADIEEKARRYFRTPGVIELQRNGPSNTVATVNGDNGTYETEIWRDDPNNPNVISLWNCSCPWGQHSWGRTRQFKKYEGRPCAHTLAVNWKAQSEGFDEETEGDEQLEIPGQDWQLQTGPAPGQTWEQFVAPTTPVPGGPNMPAPQPVAPPAPQPAPPRPQRPPSHLKGPNELQTTLDIPGTFSRVAASFNNGDLVRTRKTQTGLDRDNYERTIPANSAGEVLWSDDDETIVIFPLDTGALEPHLVKVVDKTENFYAAPKTQPFVKRRSFARNDRRRWVYDMEEGDIYIEPTPMYGNHFDMMVEMGIVEEPDWDSLSDEDRNRYAEEIFGRYYAGYLYDDGSVEDGGGSDDIDEEFKEMIRNAG